LVFNVWKFEYLSEIYFVCESNCKISPLNNGPSINRDLQDKDSCIQTSGLSDREVSNRTGASRKFECKNALEEEGLLLITNFVLDDLLILNNIVILLNKW